MPHPHLGSCQTAWLAALLGSPQRGSQQQSLGLPQVTGGGRFCEEMVCASICTHVTTLARLWAA